MITGMGHLGWSGICDDQSLSRRAIIVGLVFLAGLVEWWSTLITLALWRILSSKFKDVLGCIGVEGQSGTCKVLSKNRNKQQ